MSGGIGRAAVLGGRRYWEGNGIGGGGGMTVIKS